jgi:hypothetical protein
MQAGLYDLGKRLASASLEEDVLDASWIVRHQTAKLFCIAAKRGGQA